ncbi:hypothetical protein RIF23_03030, partial [Lipingzhangella sp. LS1_29]
GVDRPPARSVTCPNEHYPSSGSAANQTYQKLEQALYQHTLLIRELTHMGTSGRQLLAAWRAQELLRALLVLARTRTGRIPTCAQIAWPLHRF